MGRAIRELPVLDPRRIPRVQRRSRHDRRPAVGGWQNPLYRSPPTTLPSRITFGNGSHNRVYGQPTGTFTPQWQQAQTLIHNGNIQQARTVIDQNLQRDASLNGYMSAVWTLEQANVEAPTIRPYRTQALEMARQRAQQNVGNPWVAIAKFSLEDQNDQAFRSATSTLV